MTQQDAEDLTALVNRCDARYKALALPLGLTEWWVVLADRVTGGNPPSITSLPDARPHLLRLRQDGGVPAECGRLLDGWLARLDAAAAAVASSLPPPPGQPRPASGTRPV
jgi:hypothetical protein